MKINAAVLSEMGMPAPYADSRPLSVESVDLVGPGPEEVLVRIETAGVCHSDLSIIEGVRPRPLPMVIGHEASGVVEEVGPGVRDLRKGDHVVSVFVASCGHCRPCATGRPALCEPGAVAAGQGTLLNGDHKLFMGGRPLFHHSGVSAFAQYATVSRYSLVKIDPEVPLDVAAVFGCAVLTGVGGAINGGGVKLGTKVAVIGLGGVGLAGVIGALAAGAEQVVAIDLDDGKLAFATELGATEVFNAADPNAAEAIRDATDGGVDVTLEFAGAAKALELGYKIVRRGGQLVTAGLPHPSPIVIAARNARRKCPSSRDTPMHRARRSHCSKFARQDDPGAILDQMYARPAG